VVASGLAGAAEAPAVAQTGDLVEEWRSDLVECRSQGTRCSRMVRGGTGCAVEEPTRWFSLRLVCVVAAWGLSSAASGVAAAAGRWRSAAMKSLSTRRAPKARGEAGTKQDSAAFLRPATDQVLRGTKRSGWAGGIGQTGGASGTAVRRWIGGRRRSKDRRGERGKRWGGKEKQGTKSGIGADPSHARGRAGQQGACSRRRQVGGVIAGSRGGSLRSLALYRGCLCGDRGPRGGSIEPRRRC
jgi:hypothetical protein